MSFEFSCFISYPHGQKNVLVPFINDFVDGLEREIYSQTSKSIFVDEYLEGGDWLDEKIGPNLCKSACMILFYTPLYFATEHIYCARELKAMQDLEERRLRFLEDKGKGLIIPIILRGKKKFPLALQNQRKFYDFTDIEFNNPGDVFRAKFAKEIKEIAQYIVDRCDQLDEISHQLSHNCQAFRLPDAKEARQFVEGVLGKEIVDIPVSFVIRTEDETANTEQHRGQ
jgi:hypothetical protein